MMESPLLNFALPHWSALPLFILPAVINGLLMLYAITFLPNTHRNRLFCLFVFLLTSAQLSDAFVHISTSEDQALTWNAISMIPLIMLVPTGISLMFEFGRRVITPVPLWVYFAIYLPAVVFGVLSSTKAGDRNMVYGDTVGWVSNPVHEPLILSIYAYLSFGSFAMPLILISRRVRLDKNDERRKKLLLLIIGVTIPLVGGIIGEAVVPLFFQGDSIPLTGPLMVTFPICTLIAIRKYNMLAFSPHRQWKTILDTIREGIIVADNNRKIVYSNPSLCELLGYSFEELVGREADALVFNLPIQPDADSGSREFQMQTKSGAPIWVLMKLSSCLDERGKRIGTIWTITDINDLKNKSIQLRRNEKRLNRAQSIAKVGDWELDFSTGLSMWSAETCRIYGLPPDQSVQTFENWLTFIHPDDRAAVRNEIENANHGYEASEFEHRIVLRDGTMKFVRSISRFEFDDNGQPIGIYGVTQDITEIKSAYEQLHITTLELETYIYKSSHDLHAPLTSILGLVNVGKREIQDQLAVQYLGMIEGQAKKLDSIRTDFIKAMLIKDAVGFDEEILLNDMIAQIIETLRYTPGFERIKIKINNPDERPLYSNSYLVKTILQNLIENSVKYQDYSRSDSELFIDINRSGNNLEIRIADNGVGIAAEFHGRIFDMYFRASESQEGSGLGLYLVKKALDKLNGKLQLSSTPGEGTIFTITLSNSDNRRSQ